MRNISMYEGGNGAADDDADARWMSYAELAEARRTTVSSAIRLVTRRGWRRQADNQGIMRALVPPKWSEPAPGKDLDPGGRLHRTIEELEGSVAELHERAETAEREARTERDRAERAELARRAEYSRGEYLRDKIDALRADLAEVTYELELARREIAEIAVASEALRRADARWRALGRLDRVREAWREPAAEAAGTE
jgi:hypothetical protein